MQLSDSYAAMDILTTAHNGGVRCLRKVVDPDLAAMTSKAIANTGHPVIEIVPGTPPARSARALKATLAQSAKPPVVLVDGRPEELALAVVRQLEKAVIADSTAHAAVFLNA